MSAADFAFNKLEPIEATGWVSSQWPVLTISSIGCRRYTVPCVKSLVGRPGSGQLEAAARRALSPTDPGPGDCCVTVPGPPRPLASWSRRVIMSAFPIPSHTLRSGRDITSRSFPTT